MLVKSYSDCVAVQLIICINVYFLHIYLYYFICLYINTVCYTSTYFYIYVSLPIFVSSFLTAELLDWLRLLMVECDIKPKWSWKATRSHCIVCSYLWNASTRWTNSAGTVGTSPNSWIMYIGFICTLSSYYFFKHHDVTVCVN